jgi:hypothetical protein
MQFRRSVGALVLATAAGACAAPALWAQTAEPAAAAPAMEVPKPNPALRQLDYFAGTWSCTGSGYNAGKSHPTTAKAHLAWDLNGFFLGVRYEEHKTKANPMPITAVEHWGYSDELKKLIAGQVDSMGGYGTQASDGWAGDQLVWTGDVHMMGQKMASRDTFVKKGDNELTHVGEIQMNGAWVKQDEQTCHRAAKKE